MRQTLNKIANQTLKLILPVTAFLVPLFFLTLTPDFFSHNKQFLLYILASISLIAFSIRTITLRKLQLTISPASGPLLILVAIYIISSIIQTPNTIQALFGSTSLIAALTIIFLTTTSSQKNSFVVKSTIFSLITSTFIASVFAIYQALDLAQNILGPAYLQSKAFNPVGGPLPLLTLTIPLLPTTIYLGIKNKQRLPKFLLFTASIVLIIASIFQINYLLPSTPETTLTLLPLSTGWSIAVDIFKNWRTALLGTGPGTFLTTFTKLRPIELNFLTTWNIRYSSSSNELLTILTTTGLLGFATFISAHLKTYIASKNSLQGLTEKDHFAVSGNLLLLSSFIIFALVPATPVLLTLSFLGLALTTMHLKITDNPKIKDIVINLVATQKNSPTTDSKANAIFPWVYTTLTIVFLSFFWFFSGRIYAASLLTKKAMDTLNTEAIKSYNYQAKSYSLDPTNSTYRINFAKTSLALANSLAQRKDLSDQDKQDLTTLIEQSIRESKNATQLDPQSVIAWENLASIYRQLTNFAEGASDWSIASYSQAINLDPTNPALRLDLGGVLLTLGDYDGAIKLFEQAIDRKPDWPNAHYNLSAAHKANENYQKALAEMRIVVQLLDPNTEDYQKAQNELQTLEKLVPPTTPTEEPVTDNQPAPDDIQLVTPTPILSPAEPVDLPSNAGPDIPEPTPTPQKNPPQPQKSNQT